MKCIMSGRLDCDDSSSDSDYSDYMLNENLNKKPQYVYFWENNRGNNQQNRHVYNNNSQYPINTYYDSGDPSYIDITDAVEKYNMFVGAYNEIIASYENFLKPASGFGRLPMIGGNAPFHIPVTEIGIARFENLKDAIIKLQDTINAIYNREILSIDQIRATHRQFFSDSDDDAPMSGGGNDADNEPDNGITTNIRNISDMVQRTKQIMDALEAIQTITYNVDTIKQIANITKIREIVNDTVAAHKKAVTTHDTQSSPQRYIYKYFNYDTSHINQQQFQPIPKLAVPTITPYTALNFTDNMVAQLDDKIVLLEGKISACNADYNFLKSKYVPLQLRPQMSDDDITALLLHQTPPSDIVFELETRHTQNINAIFYDLKRIITELDKIKDSATTLLTKKDQEILQITEIDANDHEHVYGMLKSYFNADIDVAHMTGGDGGRNTLKLVSAKLSQILALIATHNNCVLRTLELYNATLHAKKSELYRALFITMIVTALKMGKYVMSGKTVFAAELAIRNFKSNSASRDVITRAISIMSQLAHHATNRIYIPSADNKYFADMVIIRYLLDTSASDAPTTATTATTTTTAPTTTFAQTAEL